MTKEYIIENFTANISVDEYISRFRDEKRFVEFCNNAPTTAIVGDALRLISIPENFCANMNMPT